MVGTYLLYKISRIISELRTKLDSILSTYLESGEHQSQQGQPNYNLFDKLSGIYNSVSHKVVSDVQSTTINNNQPTDVLHVTKDRIVTLFVWNNDLHMSPGGAGQPDVYDYLHVKIYDSVSGYPTDSTNKLIGSITLGGEILLEGTYHISLLKFKSVTGNVLLVFSVDYNTGSPYDVHAYYRYVYK